MIGHPLALRTGLAVGCGAAFAMEPAALWVHDFDAWTVAAPAGLPVLGALPGRRAAAPSGAIVAE